ncbi:MAG: hypothetical protein AAGC46_11255 [Solirubrobacteraceae bacterium]|nr:hypothetical protein [Patulibacter sp.]
MADKLNVQITQSPDGTYGATVVEFPGVEVSGASSLEQLREALQTGIAAKIEKDGGDARPVKLPPLVPGATTSVQS